jgi:hypothetical protein
MMMFAVMAIMGMIMVLVEDMDCGSLGILAVEACLVLII